MIRKKIHQEPDFRSKSIENKNSTFSMISDQVLFLIKLQKTHMDTGFLIGIRSKIKYQGSVNKSFRTESTNLPAKMVCSVNFEVPYQSSFSSK